MHVWHVMTDFGYDVPFFIMAVDLTEKYTKTVWKRDGIVLNPNFAMLINEINNYDIFVLQGGTRSGKTYATLQFIWANMAQFANVKYSVVRQSMPTLKGTVIPDFVEIGNDAGLYNIGSHNQTEQKYKHDGNDLWFFSAEDEEKLRGRKQHFLYLNEAPELAWESVQQLLFRTSGKIILDYNPSYPDSWVYDNILTRDKVAFIRTTFKHNPHLSKRQLDELEWMRVNDPQGYLVYGLGQRGEIQGQVYTHFKRIKDKSFPKEAEVFCLDFGFSSDPTAIIRGCIEGRTMYIKELVYQPGLSNVDILIHLFFNGYNKGKGHLLIADSANPKDISELRYGERLEEDYLKDRVADLGYSFKRFGEFERLKEMIDNGIDVVGAIKGKGSIRSGIKRVKGLEVLITEGSSNVWKEESLYKYKKDRFTGRFTQEPLDKDNHLMDCIRYMALAEGRYFNIG